MKEQQCSYCGHSYPYPVELHHSEQECQDNLAFARYVADKMNGKLD